MADEKHIIARMKKDWINPYSKWGNKIPVVVEGNHSEYRRGTRLDWGLVQSALDDGYEITIKPYKTERKTKKRK